MKLFIILGLLISAASFANTSETQTKDKTMLWPRITVWPTGIDLNIQNFTEDDYSCSGTIYINHQSRRMSTEYYFGRIYSRGFEHRRFFNRFYNDRIVSANHSISCLRL